MGREIKMTKDTTLSGDEYIRGIDSDGKSVIIPIEVIQSFISVNQRFAIYDGAAWTEGGGTVPFNLSFSDELVNQDIRLEFTGLLTEEDYWPPAFNAAFFNDESAPNPTKFDFRNLPLGTFVEFDLEFDLRLGDDSGDRIDKNLKLFCDFVYPNGNTETREYNIPNDYIVATSAEYNPVKLSFSTYIKATITDSVLGGYVKLRCVDSLGATEILTIKDLVIQAKL